MNRNIILGAGTGRCGTMSLAKVLNNCKGANITHEMGPILPYKKDYDVYKEYLDNILSKEGKYVGDVSGYTRNYIEDFIRDVPNIKIIWITRENDKTIRSMKAKEDINLFADDTSHPFSKTRPNWTNLSKNKAIELFVKVGNEIAEELMHRFPANFKVFYIEDLNSKEGQDKIFNWCGIPKKDRVYTANSRYNAVLNQ